MDMHRFRFVGLVVFLAALAVTSLLLITSGQAATTIRYVAPGGACGSKTPCYSTIQAAVDAAQAGDEIRVAAGTYSGINNQGGSQQVVYIDKSLTLRGGFTISNWNTPNPEANVTEINALTLGRVLYISGEETAVTLEGLQLTYGDSSGLGGHSPTTLENYDAGGGLYSNGSDVTIDQCVVGHNFAPSNGYGGGLYLRAGVLEMTDALVELNEAGSGGGLYLYEAQSQISANTTLTANRGSAIRAEKGDLTLQQSRVESNEDGGVSAFKNPVVIENNVISGTINGSGLSVNGGGRVNNNHILSNDHAGLSIGDGDFTVVENEIAYNRGKFTLQDPGILIQPVWGGDVTLRANHIHHNQNIYAACEGAGVYIDTGPGGLVTLANNLIEDNFAGQSAPSMAHGYGGGVYLRGDNIMLDGNVIRNNTAFGFIWASTQYWGGHGGGVYINDSPTLQNNIIANNIVVGGDSTHFHAPGIYVNGGSPELIHNTIANNTGGDGVGLYVIQDSFTEERSQAQLFNTIVVSHTVGIYAPGEVAENIVIADGILWSGNGVDTSGTGTFFLSNETTGDPAFAAPASGDYHLKAKSAAIDKGVDSSITGDIDGELRFAGQVDLGADEYWLPGSFNYLFLPLMIND